jgi:eukaryotic-like serine/threonine-protein kinase
LSSAERARALDAKGRSLEAAVAWDQAGEPARALESLARIGASHPRYRAACVLAVELAERAGGPTLAFETLVAAFVRGGPQTDAELEAFRRLGQLYESAGFPENAAEVYRKVVAASHDAQGLELLADLSPAAADLPELPAIPAEPELPELPELSSREADDLASSDPDQQVPFRVGASILDRYVLEEKIGAGGMSVVFRATDTLLGDSVALKVLTQGVYDRETDERLKRELQLSRRVQHRNVVRLFDIGLAHGFRFITMELLSGFDLRTRMRGVPLPLGEGLDYLIQAASGLEAAHAEGIVHRDVKPENCFISQGSVIKLMDFGLAKLQNAKGVTTTGIVAGTPAYMAPEQIMDFRSVGPAADIYSLGIVAYEMFTATLPFDHPDPVPLMMMQASDPPPPPRSRNPALSPELEMIILDCLEKRPEERIASCSELARRLQAFRLKL